MPFIDMVEESDELFCKAHYLPVLLQAVTDILSDLLRVMTDDFIKADSGFFSLWGRGRRIGRRVTYMHYMLFPKA